jgi:cobalt/nickel transport system permease protein
MTFDEEYFNMGYLDTLSYKNTFIHRLDPRTKVIATFMFIVTVVSFPKYEITGLFPFFLFPVLVFSLADIPVWLVLKKVLFVSSFAVLIGIFNPLIDNRVMFSLGGIPVSGGWVSFFSIMLRFFLTISAVLLLIATTSFPGICHALRRLGMPELFVSQLLFLYRYLFVLMEEAMRMVRARDMRSFGGKSRGIKVFISLIGTLFLRTMERAERIYHAMLSRGFTGTMLFVKTYHLRVADFTLLTALGVALYILRTYDVVGTIGRQTERMF